MDILFTIIASILMLVGFLVICRTGSEGEDDFEYIDDDEDETLETTQRDTPAEEAQKHEPHS